MSSDEFGSAVRARLKEMGRSQEWLGAEVARLTDRDAPYRQASVWAWIEGENPAPAEVVFAMEVALQLRAGTLSRLLGYLPVTSRSARSACRPRCLRGAGRWRLGWLVAPPRCPGFGLGEADPAGEGGLDLT